MNTKILAITKCGDCNCHISHFKSDTIEVRCSNTNQLLDENNLSNEIPENCPLPNYVSSLLHNPRYIYGILVEYDENLSNKSTNEITTYKIIDDNAMILGKIFETNSINNQVVEIGISEKLRIRNMVAEIFKKYGTNDEFYLYNIK